MRNKWIPENSKIIIDLSRQWDSNAHSLPQKSNVLNETAAKGTYYDVNKAAEVKNKTTATRKTCSYNAFF